MKICIPIFDGITALDAVGPYEVLSRVPEAEVVFCGVAGPGPVRTETGMLGLVADQALRDLPAPEVIVFPGGFGTRALIDQEPVLRWLRAAHGSSRYTCSVCTGSLVLAAAGLLDGLDATTHWLATDQLASLGARPVSERIVERDRIITAAGVSAGIDMALLLAARLAGEQVARMIQLTIEYDPEPPFPGGSASTSPPEIVERVRSEARRRRGVAASDAEDDLKRPQATTTSPGRPNSH